MTHKTFLRRLKVKMPKTTEGAIDFTYQTLYDWVEAGKFAEFDKVLEDMKIGEYAPAIVMSVLTVAAPPLVRKQLSHRNEFYELTREFFVDKYGSAGADQLLYGLD